MKRTVLFLLVLSSLSFAQNTTFLTNKFNKLCNEKQFFSLNRELIKSKDMLNDMQRLYFGAILDNAFNRPESSNKSIRELFSGFKDQLTDSMAARLLECRISNSVNLFDYKDAAAATDSLIDRYDYLYEKDFKDELVNSGLIWKAASDLQPQEMTVTADTRIDVKKDIAALSNIGVNINGSSEQFIFDTGANFSTVSESYASKLRLSFLKGNIKVGTSTGIKVESRLAYTKSMIIGNMKFNNVLFLVLPDEALSFGGGVYVINGIIGFPVIKEMKEIQLTENELFVPMNSKSKSVLNLSFDGFTPLVETVVNSDTLVFVFDTGAKKTMIYHPYYEMHKEEIDKNYSPEEIRIGGAGGEIKVKGFKLDNIIFKVASSSIKLDDVSLISVNVKKSEEYTFGNLGSDFTGSFRVMIIDFANMSLEFSD
jgi:predicted aspartyl protease